MKKIIPIITMSAALIVALLTGCSNDDVVETQDAPCPIAFTPMEIQTAKEITRGSQLTVPTITSYGVSCSFYPAANSYTTAACGSYFYNVQIDAIDGNSGHYWPGSDYKVSFFAYAPYGATGLSLVSKNDIGYPRYTYTIPSAIASQADFITADILNNSGEGTLTPVPLTFYHRCADFRFSVYNQGATSLTVHSIGVYGVKYSGTFCESSSPKWTLTESVNSTSSNPFLLTVGSTVAAGATLDATGTTNHFIMLPQTVASGTQIFDVDATVGGVRQHYYHTLPSNFEIQASKVYTFTLTLGEGLMIVDTSTEVTDWEVETKYLAVGSVGSNSTWTQPGVTGGNGIDIDDWTEEE